MPFLARNRGSSAMDSSRTNRAQRGGAELLELNDIDLMIKALTERRFQMEADACLTEHSLLQDFLAHLKRLKDDQLIQLKRETSVIQSDLERVTNLIDEIKLEGRDRVPHVIDSERIGEEDMHDINAGNSISTGEGAELPSLERDHGFGDPMEGMYYISCVHMLTLP